jgi:hypothetical protein
MKELIMIKKLKNHFKAWNMWRKSNNYSKIYKMLVLLKLKYNIAFELHKKINIFYEEAKILLDQVSSVFGDILS